MTPKQAKIFWIGRSQAIRLPVGFRFKGDTVLVRREGNALVLQGQAKFWLEPKVALAQNYDLSPRQMTTALRLVRKHQDEIRAAWKDHFGGRSQ